MSATTPETRGKKPALAPEQGMSKGLRCYVYFTATITGAAIMVVEILGAKMLSPFMGTSHFAWTAQIAVTLVALACGYYAGGRMADRSPHLARLYWAIIISAVYLAFTVLVIEPVAYWCLDFNLVAGSLLASAILYFLPLSLLAMTGPFLVRMITASVLNVGGNVGRLTALGTVGSFLGTMFVGYLVIPLLPNSVTMYLTSGSLAAIALIYFAVFRRKNAGGALILCALGALPVLLAPTGVRHHFNRVEEKFRGNSHFGLLQVIDGREGAIRYYLNDNLVQNTYDPETGQSVSVFTYMLAGMAECYTTNIQDVLCIGMGVGIVPMHFARAGANVDVVEINPEVLPVAEKWFGFDPSKARVIFDDGRHYLNRCRKQYDAVVLDAFLGDSSPSHLMTREAFESIKRVLRPGGALVINMFGELEPGNDFFAASLDKTLRAVFPGVRLHGTGEGAVFFTATPRPAPEFVRPVELDGVHPVVREDYKITMASSLRTDPNSGRILTDDYNPVEFYDAKNRENVRRRLALAWKDL